MTEAKPEADLIRSPAAPVMDTKPETEHVTQDANADPETASLQSAGAIMHDPVREAMYNRRDAVSIAAQAMRGTNGVTAKGLLYLANEIEQYVNEGYDAAKHNG